LIFGYLSDSTIRIWDNTGQERTSIRFNAEIMNLKISPDNLLLACVGNNDSLVLYSISGEKLYSFACSANSLNQKDLVSFASQRNHVACISETNSAMVYNLSDGTPLQKLSSHRAPVTSVCFSPDEKWLLTASKDSTVQVWKYNETKNEYLKFVLLTGHTDVVWSAVFNKESNYILTASADSTVKMWKLTGEEHRYDYNESRYYFASHLSPVARAVFSSSGTSIILDRYGHSGKLKRGSFANNGLWFELEQMSDKKYKKDEFRYYQSIIYSGEYIDELESDTIFASIDMSRNNPMFAVQVDGSDESVLVLFDRYSAHPMVSLQGINPIFSPDAKNVLCVVGKKLFLYPVDIEYIESLVVQNNIFKQ